jgi:hypothetical protein
MSASLDIARRAVACKGWRRMSGMLGADGWRVVDVGTRDDGAEWADLVDPSCRPDDPATLGCLLALVREAWGDERIELVCYGNWCELDVSSRGRAYNQAALFEIGGESLAAVFVAALEAAP